MYRLNRTFLARSLSMNDWVVGVKETIGSRTPFSREGKNMVHVGFIEKKEGMNVNKSKRGKRCKGMGWEEYG